MLKSEKSQYFDVELAIWNDSIFGHVCSEHGVCTEARIGRNMTRPIYANQKVLRVDHVVIPPDVSLGHIGAPHGFSNLWGIFSFGSWWHYVVVVLLGILALLVSLVLLKFAGPFLSCFVWAFKWALPKRQSKVWKEDYRTRERCKG